MDYAVKEMKKFDLDSYAIERKILELGNSTPLGIFFCQHFVESSFIRYVKIEYHFIN